MRSRVAGPHHDNKSGYKGVHWCEPKQKWMVDVLTENQRIRLGRYDSAEEAAVAYDSFVINYLPPDSYTNLIPWGDDDWTEQAAFMRTMRDADEMERAVIKHALEYVRDQKKRGSD